MGYFARNRSWAILVGGALTLVCSVAAVLGVRSHCAKNQVAAMAHVEALGGTVTLDYELSGTKGQWTQLRAFLARRLDTILSRSVFGTVVKVDLSSSRITDEDLAVLCAFPDMVWLGLFDTAITDSGLETVGSCTQLELLWLDKTAISDRGIRELSRLNRLHTLLIQYNPIGDAAMVDVARLHNLRELALGGTRVTDAGIEQLAGLNLQSITLNDTMITDEAARTLGQFSGLRHLDLYSTNIGDEFFQHSPTWSELISLRIWNTAISDESVDDIAKLKSLRHLGIGSTRISDAGAAAIRRSLPFCEIRR